MIHVELSLVEDWSSRSQIKSKFARRFHCSQK